MKTKIIFVSILVLLFQFQSVYATSGACSGHDGVKCSAGPTYGGKVICNDNWMGSSVDFYNVAECKNIVIKVPDTTYFTCKTESDYARVQQTVNDTRSSMTSMNLRSGLIGDYSTLDQDKLDKCRESINIYNAEVAARNKYSQTQKEIFDQQQKQTSNLLQPIELKNLCVSLYGEGSFWNESLSTSTNGGTKCTLSDKEKNNLYLSSSTNIKATTTINKKPLDFSAFKTVIKDVPVKKIISTSSVSTTTSQIVSTSSVTTTNIKKISVRRGSNMVNIFKSIGGWLGGFFK